MLKQSKKTIIPILAAILSIALHIGCDNATWEDAEPIDSLSHSLTKSKTISGIVSRKGWRHHGPFSTVSTFKVEMTGTGDADLYVKKGSRPSSRSYNCRPYRSGSKETCSLNGSGKYFVSVYGYYNGSSKYQLKISYNTNSNKPVAVEQHAPSISGVKKSKWINIRNNWINLAYEVIDGQVIIEGDMILGNEDELNTYWSSLNDNSNDYDEESHRIGVLKQSLVVRKGSKYLWENGVVPYTISSTLTTMNSSASVPVTTMDVLVQDAINHWENNTNIRFRPKTSSDTSYVKFKKSSDNGCSSSVGNQGKKQYIHLASWCGVGSIVHEIGHAVGIWHEQSRCDRDNYIEVLKANIINSKEHNYKKHCADGIDLGAYDYGSIMHYPSVNGFSEQDALGNYLPTFNVLQPVPAGVTIGQRNGLSANDILQIQRLYPYNAAHSGGSSWGEGNYATSIAFGDVDGDGRDEVGITRKSGSNDRYWILNDKNAGFGTLHKGGSGWGSSNYATSIAFGDVDGDGRDEVGIARKAGSNSRYWILDGFGAYGQGGGGRWGSSNYATSIAFGDVNGDGDADLGIARKAGSNMRYKVLEVNVP